MSIDYNISLPRRTPESQGISSSVLLAFINEAEAKLDALHSFMMVRHGSVIAEGWWSPYGRDIPHMLFSLSKSFASTAAGLAIAEGKLSLEDTVVSFFPDDLPATVSTNLAAMRVRDLLAMATGNADDTTPFLWQEPDGNWARAFLARPVEHPPGTYFVYNSGATYMVSAIVQKVTGQTLLDYLAPRLFDPLGIKGATWESCPRGINVGGWGLNITTEDIAKFGQLYLQKGVWNGASLLPAAWVEEATSKQVSNRRDSADPEHDWNQGYGYQFWRSRHGAYRGDGAFGQYCVVLQEQDTVFAITSGIGDMGSVLNLIWEKLLPAIESGPLPEDPDACDRLQSRLAALELPTPAGNPTSPMGAAVHEKTYQFEPDPNDADAFTAITFDFTEPTVQLTFANKDGNHRISCGLNGTWSQGTTSLMGPPRRPAEERPIAVSGAWETEDTFVVKLVFYETPFVWTARCRFDGDRVEVQAKVNVGFGPTGPVQRIGVAS